LNIAGFLIGVSEHREVSVSRFVVYRGFSFGKQPTSKVTVCVAGRLYRRVISRIDDPQHPQSRDSSGHAAVLRPTPVNYAFHVLCAKWRSEKPLTTVAWPSQHKTNTTASLCANFQTVTAIDIVNPKKT